MPLGVMGGVSSEEAQLLGGGMAVYGETTVDTSIFGDDLGDPTSCSAAFFGLSTGKASLLHHQPVHFTLDVEGCRNCKIVRPYPRPAAGSVPLIYIRKRSGHDFAAGSRPSAYERI